MMMDDDHDDDDDNNNNNNSNKMRGISCLAENRIASQKGLCSME